MDGVSASSSLPTGPAPLRPAQQGQRKQPLQRLWGLRGSVCLNRSWQGKAGWLEGWGLGPGAEGRASWTWTGAYLCPAEGVGPGPLLSGGTCCHAEGGQEGGFRF